MKVRVTLTLDVDPEAWWTTYGREPHEVREDVRTWVENLVHQTLLPEELGTAHLS